MAKKLMRRYSTQAEYDADINNLHVDTVSVIIENDIVNYGVMLCPPNAVMINGKDIITTVENNKIISREFSARKDIITVEIGSDITEIGDNAFRECSNLTTVIINGNMTNIGNSAFYNCTFLSAFKYYGTTSQNTTNALMNTSLSYIEVNKNYSENTFCGKRVKKVL